MEGRIEKHTLSSGQDIEREKQTHFYKVLKGLQIIWNTRGKHTAVMLCALPFQAARSTVEQALPYIF